MPDVTETPASDSPTSNDAPLAGAAVDPEDQRTALPSPDTASEDAFAALKQRAHPFA